MNHLITAYELMNAYGGNLNTIKAALAHIPPLQVGRSSYYNRLEALRALKPVFRAICDRRQTEQLNQLARERYASLLDDIDALEREAA